MESTKKVIKITELPSVYNDMYGTYDYFQKIDVDNNGNLQIHTTSNIWNATKFNNHKVSYGIENEKRINALVELLKSFLGKKYSVEVIEVTLKYLES